MIDNKAIDGIHPYQVKVVPPFTKARENRIASNRKKPDTESSGGAYRPSVFKNSESPDQIDTLDYCSRGIELARAAIASYSTIETVSHARRYHKFAVIGGFLYHATPLAAALTLSRILRVSSGVGASASAISVIPLRMTDGVSSTAWIM